jgi:hypothetical protein
LIKDNLFPFSIDREERNTYLDALEAADQGCYQALVDTIANNQIASIQEALNWQVGAGKSGYDSILKGLGEKLNNRNGVLEEKRKEIARNMLDIFAVMKASTEKYGADIENQLGQTVKIEIEDCPPASDQQHYYTHQIAEYAGTHKYYFNSSLQRCWTRIRIFLGGDYRYQLIFSLHHYGYDNSAFALGAFIEKEDSQGQEICTPVEVPPLVLASERTGEIVNNAVRRQMEDIMTVGLAYITEEIN